jgi:hypothetical protein
MTTQTRAIAGRGSVGAGGGVTDHGALDAASLLDDDHPQYLLRSEIVSAVIDCILTDGAVPVVDGGKLLFDGSTC